jgi:hypothetical protein
MLQLSFLLSTFIIMGSGGSGGEMSPKTHSPTHTRAHARRYNVLFQLHVYKNEKRVWQNQKIKIK